MSRAQFAAIFPTVITACSMSLDHGLLQLSRMKFLSLLETENL